MEKLHRLLVEDYLADPANMPRLLKGGVDNDVYSFTTLAGESKVACIGRRKNAEALSLEINLLGELTKRGAFVAQVIPTVNGEDSKELDECSRVVCFNYITMIQ